MALMKRLHHHQWHLVESRALNGVGMVLGVTQVKWGCHCGAFKETQG